MLLLYAVVIFLQNRSRPGGKRIAAIRVSEPNSSVHQEYDARFAIDPPQTEPPVVWSWLPFLGSAVAFGQAPLDFIRESSARMQAPCFVLVLAGERTCFVADPALWAQVFRERRRLR